MPHCPECGAEYVERIVTCADCNVALAPGPRPDAPAPAFAGTTKWVGVKSGRAAEIEIVASLLEQEGIPVDVRIVVEMGELGLSWAGGAPLVQLRVPEPRAAEACELIDKRTPEPGV